MPVATWIAIAVLANLAAASLIGRRLRRLDQATTKPDQAGTPAPLDCQTCGRPSRHRRTR